MRVETIWPSKPYSTDLFSTCTFDDSYANLHVWTQSELLFVFEDIVVLRGLSAIWAWMIKLHEGNWVQFILQICERSRHEITWLQMVNYRIFIDKFPWMVENSCWVKRPNLAEVKLPSVPVCPQYFHWGLGVAELNSSYIQWPRVSTISPTMLNSQSGVMVNLHN